MPRLDPIHWALAAVFAAILVWAAFTDIKSRRIPNAAVLGLVAIFAAWALAGAPAGLGSGLAAAAIGFAVGFALYLFKVMGAGDVKLFAATALFIGLVYLPMFALATALAGGAVAVVSLLARPRRSMVMFAMRGKGGQAEHGRGVPYGVAISVAGVLTLWALAAGVTLVDVLHPRT
jgi:prepilin peptidase CpaA